MNPSRRACLRTIAALSAALPISHTWATAHKEPHGRTAEPAVLVRQETLVESGVFANEWEPSIQRMDIGTDIGLALFGRSPFDWHALRAPVLGLTTPASLFCLEQVASTAGVRTVARITSSDAGTPTGAAARLHAALGRSMPWQPLTPAFSASPEPWVAWMMVPRAALKLDE